MNTLFCKMILIALFLQSRGANPCRINVCMKWMVHDNVLVITCKVQDLLFEVTIEDPFGTKHGHCITPIRTPNFSHPVECFPNYPNGTLSQNIETGETIFRMQGKIDKSLNGNWKCFHGTNKDKGTVEVTVPDISSMYRKEILEQQLLQPEECWLLFWLWTILGFAISFFFLTLVVMCLIKRDGTANKSKILNVFYHLCDTSISQSKCSCEQSTKAKLLTVLKIILCIVTIIMMLIPFMFVGITFKNQCKDAPYFVILGLLSGAVAAILLVDRGVAIEMPPNPSRRPLREE